MVKNTMRSAIFARFVRLKAITWSIFAAARLEFEGRYVGREYFITPNILKQKFSEMDDSSYRRNFDLDKKIETITIAGKSIFK